MDPANENSRRVGVRELLEKHDFSLTNARDKSDEFKTSDGKAVYYFWKQGGGINIAIDPRLPFDVIKSIPGVEFSKKNPFGIRGGSSMSEFPREYQGFRPKDENSKVGRMFVVDPASFSVFVGTLIDILSGRRKPRFDSLDAQSASINEGSAHAADTNAEDNFPDVDESGGAGTEEARVGAHDARSVPDWDELRKKIDEECAGREGRDVDALAKRRVGQGVFRDLLISRFDGTCCMTGLKNIRLLIASHIVPWSVSDSNQKLSPDNGLLLSVAMDALFDKGLISFSDNGSILVANDLDAETIEILGLNSEFVLSEKLLTDGRKENLAKHREHHGFDASVR